LSCWLKVCDPASACGRIGRRGRVPLGAAPDAMTRVWSWVAPAPRGTGATYPEPSRTFSSSRTIRARRTWFGRA
jgi:hypothetical protein